VIKEILSQIATNAAKANTFSMTIKNAINIL
jgi:hypothetical protein